MTAPRPARADEGLLGVAPGSVIEPASALEAAEAMQACARDRRTVAFLGGGTDLGLGAPPSSLDVLLRTSRLDRVVEHSPSDQIVVVEAGVTLAALQRTLAAHGQRLALDPPRAAQATVGGVVAANAWGPRRTRFGTARDLIIGISVVRADGVAARGGGKVVKNVAGFDLPRLFVGSLGTLGLITSATFRLHPLPEASATVLADGPSAGQVRALVTSLRQAQVEPTSVTLLAARGALRLGLRFEGFGPGVRQQSERLLAQGAKLGVRCEALDDAAATSFWEACETARTSGTVRARLAAPPSAIEAVVQGVVSPLAAGLDQPWAVLEPTLGVGVAGGEATRLPEALAALARARRTLEGLRGSLTLAAAPPEVRAGFDAWGTPPASLAVMRRLKDRLDPEHRLAPGRFVGGI